MEPEHQAQGGLGRHLRAHPEGHRRLAVGAAHLRAALAGDDGTRRGQRLAAVGRTEVRVHGRASLRGEELGRRLPVQVALDPVQLLRRAAGPQRDGGGRAAGAAAGAAGRGGGRGAHRRAPAGRRVRGAGALEQRAGVGRGPLGPLVAARRERPLRGAGGGHVRARGRGRAQGAYHVHGPGSLLQGHLLRPLPAAAVAARGRHQAGAAAGGRHQQHRGAGGGRRALVERVAGAGRDEGAFPQPGDAAAGRGGAGAAGAGAAAAAGAVGCEGARRGGCLQCCEQGVCVLAARLAVRGSACEWGGLEGWEAGGAADGGLSARLLHFEGGAAAQRRRGHAARETFSPSLLAAHLIRTRKWKCMCHSMWISCIPWTERRVVAAVGCSYCWRLDVHLVHISRQRHPQSRIGICKGLWVCRSRAATRVHTSRCGTRFPIDCNRLLQAGAPSRLRWQQVAWARHRFARRRGRAALGGVLSWNCIPGGASASIEASSRQPPRCSPMYVYQRHSTSPDESHATAP